VGESYTLFSAVRNGLPLADVRASVVAGEVIQKRSYQTRRKIWDAISRRYLSVCAEWVGGSLAEASESGLQSAEYLSLAYLYFALRDRLVFDFVTQVVSDKWQRQATAIDRYDVLEFLKQQADEFPQINRWRESTLQKLASNALSSLRDFGVVRGIRKKYIQRPTIASETVFHLLCILMAEGLRGQAILSAPDWRLFLWSETEVASALSELAQKRWIRFERVGRTVILEMIRMPEVPNEPK
ncbi:MAG TPA: BrxA family protein, partial [Coleofasciculaceae cyanobacterium]